MRSYPHCFVNFEYLDAHGIFLSELFDDLKLKSFCTTRDEVHPTPVALFYSNFHFPNRDSFNFSFAKKTYTVTLDELAEIINTEYNVLKKILIEPNEAYNFVLETDFFSRF